MNKKNIAIIAIVLVIIIAIILIAINIKSQNTEKTTSDTKITSTDKKTNEVKKENNIESEERSMYSSGIHHATIEVKDYGIIKLELDANKAPITVSNFAKLVEEGFYNGLTFHRIIGGFMMQGGDPTGTGFGGSDEKIKGEFTANGVKNDISHVRGVISMARSSAYNSASSQFFIVHQDSKFLDGQYAGFGKVLEGIEIVDKICENTKVEDSNGTVQKENQPIIDKITMED